MKIRSSTFFFPLWFLFPVLGGIFGFFMPIEFGLGILAGAVVFWACGIYYWRHQVSTQALILRKVSAHPNFPEELRASWFPDELSEGSVENAFLKVLDHSDSKSNAPLSASSTGQNFIRGSASEEDWRGFFQTLEELNQSVHDFRDVTRDWASSIEKAGRINRSVLQLNELIVNDSKKVAQDTDDAARTATEGIKSVGKEIKAMTDLKATIGSSAEVIQQLSLASDQIGEFLATITTIARKTNLLALNAGIEAARAGEHGQGFAVVATEIKTLAEASAKASGDVKHLVDDIRSKTSSAISLISTTGKIEENVNVVYSAGDVFMNIVKSIRKAGGLLGEISQALEDQRNDNELLLQLINRIYLSGDQVRDRFVAVEDGLAQLQKVSQQLRSSGEQPKA